MAKKTKKSDIKFDHKRWPMMAYRLQPEVKEYFEKDIKKLEKAMNRDLSPVQPKMKRTQIFIKALDLGLKELKKRNEVD